MSAAGAKSVGAGVLIMAGGTGGHIYPGLAVARVLRERGVGVRWLGATDGMECTMVPDRGIEIDEVRISGVRGKGISGWLSLPFRLLRAILDARASMRQAQPACAISFGGYAAGPGGLAAWLKGIPLIVHEQNRIPGMTNRFLARIADVVFQAFPETFASARGAQTCGNPVRRSVADLPVPDKRFFQRSGKPRLLVTGGSQGARSLNERVPAALAMLEPAARPRVFHQTGPVDIESTRVAYREASIQAEVEPYIEDMAEAYAWADLALCRAGALTVSELAAAGLGSVLIPFPHAVDDHQTGNADFLAAPGAARVMQESGLTPAKLADTLAPLLASRAVMLEMAKAARSVGVPDAADRVAEACNRWVAAQPRGRGGVKATGGQLKPMRRIRKVHFVGIGGSGMSGIAEVLVNQGFEVSGSDLQESAAARHLKKLGVEVHYEHEAQLVKDADVLVVSSAVPDDNVEIQAAREARIPVVPRAQMLAELMRFRRGIAVAGTHGKTTTTSLTASLLAEADLDPTFVIGGVVNAWGSNARLGAGEYLVAEADESDGSFLLLQPVIALVTNIDRDHLESYGGSFDNLRRAFLEFLQHLPFYGAAILCIDDPEVAALVPGVTRAIVTFGLAPDADVRATDLRQEGRRMHFNVHVPQGATPLPVILNLPGVHNVRNALGAIAVAWELGLELTQIVDCLAAFEGIGRRFADLGHHSLDGRTIQLIEDYGHHPTEIAATIAAARSGWPEQRLVVVFQPHRYSRTRDLFDDFSVELSAADLVVLTDIYPAGEDEIEGIDSRALCQSIRARGRVDPVLIHRVEDLLHELPDLLEDGDLVLLMGAGSIGLVAQELCDFEPAREVTA